MQHNATCSLACSTQSDTFVVIVLLFETAAVDAHRIIRNSPTVESISASTASSPSPMGDGTDVGEVTEPSSRCNDGVVCQRSEKSVFIGSYGDVGETGYVGVFASSGV